MNELELFHFLRPWWLLGLPVVLACWWLVRKRETGDTPLLALLPDHLAAALTMGRAQKSVLRPADTVFVALLFMVFAVAGPTWSKEPSPWFSENAPLVIALEVSDSMRANDVQPTRLDRARFKILDLLALRTGVRTALIAYAGSAHVVVPPTKDVAVIKPFLESLDPGIMPLPGTEASRVLPLAAALLGDDAATATVLFVTDGFSNGDPAAFADYADAAGNPALAALIVGTQAGGLALAPDGTPLRTASGGRLETVVDETLIAQVARAGDMSVTRLTNSDADLRTLNRILERNLRQADDPSARWHDQGWWFVLPAALLVLLWFRKGWSNQW